MEIRLPEDVKKIIEILHAHGAEGYAVGGCIRDTLLGRKPKDWDVTTSASPQEVKAWFYKTVDTGIEHGTVTVMLHHVGYEVTTYRIDGRYKDGRHPESVTFTKSLAEDLKRRDLTINAMAYCEEEGLKDLYGGREDLEKKIIRAVGNPEERFTEDALRIMRCIRFAAQLGFEIEEETFRAAGRLAPNLKNISRERVREELLKTLVSDHPDYITLFSDLGVMQEIIPTFDPGNRHTLEMLRSLPPEKNLRLAALFLHSRETAEESALECGFMMDAFKFDNDTKKKVQQLVRMQDIEISEDPYACRLAVHMLGKDHVLPWLQLMRADRLKAFDAEERMIREIIESGTCTTVRELAVTGRDLIGLGFKSGRGMGEVLDWLLKEVLKDPALNNKEALKKLTVDKFMKEE